MRLTQPSSFFSVYSVKAGATLCSHLLLLDSKDDRSVQHFSRRFMVFTDPSWIPEGGNR